MSSLSSPAGSSGASSWQFVIPTGLATLKRSHTCLDSEYFNQSLIQKRRQNADRLPIFSMPWNSTSVVDQTLKKLLSRPATVVHMPDNQVFDEHVSTAMAIRPQYTYASSIMS